MTSSTRDEARDARVKRLADALDLYSQFSIGGRLISQGDAKVVSDDLRALLSPEEVGCSGSDQPWDGNSCPSECERGHIYSGPVCPACPMESDQPQPSVSPNGHPDQGALKIAAEPFCHLSVFPADLDMGDDEEIEITVTRRQVKALAAAVGIDPKGGE